MSNFESIADSFEEAKTLLELSQTEGNEAETKCASKWG
ncbi:Uncharacterised protein [Orientia tsutsugamushi]|nr:Uncharacterised protein [Orientia tsutsugamushi]